MNTYIAKIYLSYLFIFFCGTGFAQSIASKCNCESYFDWKKIDKKSIEYDSLYIKVVKLDTLNDDGCSENFKILKDSSNYLLIVPFWNIPSKKMKPIWIKKEGQLAVTIQCQYSSTFNIYSKPDSASKVCFSKPCKDVNFGFLTIIGCTEGWIKVEFVLDNKKYIGWVNLNAGLCSNPCTTCN